jgi:sulfonate transport system substrate-binding protein
VTANTSSEYYLIDVLRIARLAESDVRVVSLEGPEMPAALKRGDVDAIAMWEPHAQNALDALGDDGVELRDGSAYRERFNLNTTTRVLRDPAKRRALVAYIRTLIQVSKEAQDRPKQIMQRISPAVNVPEITLSKVWNQFRFPANLSPELLASMAAVEPWAASVQKRAARDRMALEALIDSSVLAEASR